MMLRFVLRVAESVLIIERAAIDERACGIEQEHLRRGRRRELLRKFAIGITGYGRDELVICDKLGEFLGFLSRRCIHQQHAHALLL